MGMGTVVKYCTCEGYQEGGYSPTPHFATFGEAIAYVDKLREAFAPVTRADFTRQA